jgi:hypothetical protein
MGLKKHWFFNGTKIREGSPGRDVVSKSFQSKNKHLITNNKKTGVQLSGNRAAEPAA